MSQRTPGQDPEQQDEDRTEAIDAVTPADDTEVLSTVADADAEQDAMDAMDAGDDGDDESDDTVAIEADTTGGAAGTSTEEDTTVLETVGDDDTAVLATDDTAVLATTDDVTEVPADPYPALDTPPATGATGSAPFGSAPSGSASSGSAPFAGAPGPTPPTADRGWTPGPTAAAPTPAPAPVVTPAPRSSGPRAGTVIWGLIVVAIGAGILAAAAGFTVDFQLAFIGLLAFAGVALLVSSLVSAIRRRDRSAS